MRLATMLVVTVTLSLPPCGRGARLNRANGGYEDIVVAIHPAVEPDERIIENIKALFRSASSLLLRATGGLVHFGSVVIAVPATWPPRPQATDAASGNLFPTADVRVAAENPQYGDAPYTLQPRGCGERGEYIHLAPRFLAEMNGSIAEIYGDPAYRLVHEWAHYRYGVFDEHGEPGSSRYPSLYCESGTVRATMCSSEPVNFTVYMDFGKPCRVYQGCRVSSQCKVMFWREGRGSDRAASSIMSMAHFVKGPSSRRLGKRRPRDVPGSAETERHARHDRIRPGRLCLHARPRSHRAPQSSGDPLRRGPHTRRPESRRGDVQHGRPHAVSPDDGVGTDARTYRQHRARFGASRQHLHRMRSEKGPRGVQEDRAPRRGLSHRAHDQRRRDLGALHGRRARRPGRGGSEDQHDRARQRGRPRARGPGPVHGGQAVRAPGRQLQRGGGRPRVGLPGLDLRPAGPRQEADCVCRVHALLDHDKRPIVVRLAFIMTLRPIVIFEETATVPKEGVAFYVLVDRDLGKGTTVTLSCDGTCSLKIELRYPDGRKCNECLTTQSTKAGAYITIRIPGTATPGTWTLVVSLCPGSREVQVHVRATSFVVDATVEPALVRSFVKRTEVNVATDAVVYAEVSKGTRLVLHARVTATVIRPRAPDGIEVELHDNGLGADVTANDGIYSGYFTWFDGVGRYSVSTRVASVDRTVIVSRRMASGGWPVTTLNSVSSKTFVGRSSAIPTAGQATGIPFSHFVYVDRNIEEAERRFVFIDEAPGFVRYAEAGSFRLNVDINPYDIPPGSVQDLTVENALVEEDGDHAVFLAWTCPGSHLYWLNASHVELRVSSRPGDLVGDFSSALRIVVTAEVGGSIDGNVRVGPVGTRQRLRIRLPDALFLHRAGNQTSTPDLYAAVTVWNDRGVSSSVSNVARVTFRRPPPMALPSPNETLLLVTVLPCLAAVAMVAMVTRRSFAKLIDCC
ncbi:calcium-activated chloride channel regulator 1-like [Dermacentor albipictus]|uniref:calcium-activated chloride channel regulator 1-like n=1 Tax=Dermacentor albipictus TaxID=60249 RepID=UPI0038FD0087